MRVTAPSSLPSYASRARSSKGTVMTIFHHARAADRVQVSLSPEQDGTDTALPCLTPYPGCWD